jgi:transcription initiation factor TFIIE subunit alpha
MWVKNNPTDADKQKAAQTGPGLKVAGSGPGTSKQDEGIGVMISMDKDESTRKLEREAEAAAKRQQNALPTWHLKSTISGDLTALGIQESARTQATGPGTSNDDILRGLGVVGAARAEPIVSAVVEDVKPVVNRESDCE